MKVSSIVSRLMKYKGQNCPEGKTHSNFSTSKEVPNAINNELKVAHDIYSRLVNVYRFMILNVRTVVKLIFAKGAV